MITPHPLRCLLLFTIGSASLLLRGAELSPQLVTALTEGRAYQRAHPPQTGRFEPDIQQMLASEKTDPVASGQILFIGSSIFRQWTSVRTDMAPLPVRNRAFGGSRTSDLLERFDLLVRPLAPRVVVYYCGSNDINVDEPAASIFARVHAFVAKLKTVQPDVRFIYVSIARAPQKKDRMATVDRANALIRDFCAATPRCRFVDINPALVDRSGNPHGGFYRDDQLHYHPAAYVAFTDVIKPVLSAEWTDAMAAAR
jgi:lysophospholipase L1-like esterase